MFYRMQTFPLWLAATAASATAYAQDTPAGPNAAPATQPGPGTGEMTGELMFFTLGAALLIGLVAMLYFLRSRSNRAAAGRVFNPKDRDRRP